MDWRAILAIVFISTAVNHLGLIKAVIGVFFKKRETLPIISCPKCLSFWSVMTYGVAEANSSLFTLNSSLRLLAIALLCSYLALWLNLLMYAIDTLYNRIYGKIEDYNQEDCDEAD